MAIVSLFFGNIWITSFMLLNLFSIMYNDFSIGLPQVLNVFLGCVLFMISRSYFKKNDSIPYLRVLLWLMALNIFWMILQASGVDPLFIAQDAGGVPQFAQTLKEYMGFFGIKMANAIFLGLCLPILGLVNLYLTPLLLIPLYMCQSSVAALSIFVSMSFYLWFMARKVFIYFIALGMLGACFYIYKDLKNDPDTFMSRFTVWHSAIKFTFQRPLGWGPDSYRSYTKQKDFLFYADYAYKNHLIGTKKSDNQIVLKYYDMDNGKMFKKNHGPFKVEELGFWDNPHNEYIQMMFEYGFFGLFLVIGLLREMYYRFKFATKSKELVVIASMIIVFLVSGIGHFPFHLARLAYIFSIILGVFFARTDEVEVA